jgi:hypothetical protein
MKHALKIEELEIKQTKADKIVEVLKDFLTDNLNFNSERVSELECRSRDGFIPFSHNKGGLEAVAFMDQMYAEQWVSAFKNASKTLEKYYKYNVELFCKERGITKLDYDDNDLIEAFDNWRENSESTVLFSADLMLTSESELNIRLCVCVKDAPYHRQYDDLIEFNVKFKNITELRTKLKAITKKRLVACFAQSAREGF